MMDGAKAAVYFLRETGILAYGAPAIGVCLLGYATYRILMKWLDTKGK